MVWYSHAIKGVFITDWSLGDFWLNVAIHLFWKLLQRDSHGFSLENRSLN